MNQKEFKSKVPAVDQAARILLCLAENNSSMSLTSICKAVGIHKSKGYEILTTLMHYGFVNKDPETKKYSLGPALIHLASNVLSQIDYKLISEPFLKKLAEETKCAAFFGVIIENYLYIVAKYEPDIDIKVTIPLGRKFPLTHGAHGKAIIASLDESQRNKILKTEKLYFYGYNKQVDFNKLSQDIEFYKKYGFAVDPGDMKPNIKAIASSVFNVKGEVIGVVLILGVFNEKDYFKFGEIVKDCAKNLSFALGKKDTPEQERGNIS